MELASKVDRQGIDMIEYAKELRLLVDELHRVGYDARVVRVRQKLDKLATLMKEDDDERRSR